MHIFGGFIQFGFLGDGWLLGEPCFRGGEVSITDVLRRRGKGTNMKELVAIREYGVYKNYWSVQEPNNRSSGSEVESLPLWSRS